MRGKDLQADGKREEPAIRLYALGYHIELVGQTPIWPGPRTISVKRPPEDYLRQAMVRTLDMRKVEIDFRVQLQTDPFLMPIENAAVLWPERLSPRVSVAAIRIPRQTFDSDTT